MKKTILTLAMLMLTAPFVMAECPKCDGPCGCPKMGPHPSGMCKPCKKPPRINLDEKLKLTDEQKAKAKEMRMQTREQMEPIMEAIKTKHEQKELIKRSQKLTPEAQSEQVEKLNKQIFELKKQARELRLKNERDFESILTSKQKKELSKLKEEAKKNMEKQKASGKNLPTK